MRKLYKYTGMISEMSCIGKKVENIVLYDMYDDSKAPTRLEPYGELNEYIYELERTDAEERYITSDYFYDSNLFLTRIEIPSCEKGIPAKVLICDCDTRGLIVFGKKEFIDDMNPEPLDSNEFQRYLAYLVSKGQGR